MRAPLRFAAMSLAALAMIAGATPLAAQPPASDATPADPLEARARDLLAFLRGEREAAGLFSAAFLAQIPEAQLRIITAQLTAAHGQPMAIDAVTPAGPLSGTIAVRFERAVATMRTTLAASDDNQIIGLLITDVTAANDELATIDGVIAAMRALPGETALSVARLGDAAPDMRHRLNADRPLAIGSTFKLVILAELVRAIMAGERRWDEAAPLTHRSLPSGILQDWPEQSPLTLHSLATLMISRSDNSATDTLLFLLDRERVEAMQAELGIAAPARNRPFLSTAEMFRLKAARGGTFGERFAGLDEAGRRALLAGELAAVPVAEVDASAFAGAPMRIAEIEWFATTDDLVRVMDWLRRAGARDARALGVLGVNPGMATDARDRIGYVGYKGGSEPGVLNLAYLVGGRDGSWWAVAASWNNPAAAVDDARFATLTRQAVTLITATAPDK